MGCVGPNYQRADTWHRSADWRYQVYPQNQHNSLLYKGGPREEYPTRWHGVFNSPPPPHHPRLPLVFSSQLALGPGQGYFRWHLSSKHFTYSRSAFPVRLQQNSGQVSLREWKFSTAWSLCFLRFVRVSSASAKLFASAKLSLLSKLLWSSAFSKGRTLSLRQLSWGQEANGPLFVSLNIMANLLWMDVMR